MDTLTEAYLVEESQKEKVQEKAAELGTDPGSAFREALEVGLENL